MALKLALQSLQQRITFRGPLALAAVSQTSSEPWPAIPDPSIFTNLSLSDQAPQYGSIETSNMTLWHPSIGQCACHLALLECFARLKRKIMQSKELDQIFGIIEQEEQYESFEGAGRIRSNSVSAVVMKTTSQKRKWEVFVELAVRRFAAWWENIEEVYKDAEKDMSQNLKNHGVEIARVRLTKNQLPPLDVLMVWHSYMLNPHRFYEDCNRYDKMLLWRLGMPWPAIYEVIDRERWIYNLPKRALSLFTSITSMPSGLQSFLEEYPEQSLQIELHCPFCRNRYGVPIATGAGSIGYVDQNFWSTCPRCQKILDKPILQAAQFINDYISHSQGERMMPGTGLSSFGEYKVQAFDTNDQAPRFLDELLRAAFGDLVEIWQYPSLGATQTQLYQTEDTAEFLQRNAKWLPTSGRRKLLIDTLLSRYRDNSSKFGLDLNSAVLRQGAFVDKMNNLLWIRSPAILGTLSRARNRYENFFRLLSTYPDQVFVPTLDVDIVWHTHQVCPEEYFMYSTAVCNGRFIDHDDKIVQGQLDGSFQETKTLWAKEFPVAGEYAGCFCWFCEGKRGYGLPGSDQDSDAVRSDVAYYRAVETARRKHETLPPHTLVQRAKQK